MEVDFNFQLSNNIYLMYKYGNLLQFPIIKKLKLYCLN